MRRRDGEDVRRLLIELKLLATNLRIFAKDDYLFIPIFRQPVKMEVEALRKQVNTIAFGTATFQAEAKPMTILDMLGDKLPPHILASLPKSLDIVGHVAIVEITPELDPYRPLIGEAVLAANKNVRTVLAKASPINTQYRIREFDILAGEDRTETVHSEYDCRYLLDVRKVYFSPRLGYEHDRVSRLVNEGETVLDMFAGVGPFSIPIAKRKNLVRVYAIDTNPEAVRYLEENIKLNRVAGKVTAILGDCRDIVHEKFRGVADRVIMNLPGQSFAYLDLACEAIKPTGGVIHVYTFSDEPVPFENLKGKMKELISSAGRSTKRTPEARIVKTVAPYRLQVVLDVSVT